MGVEDLSLDEIIKGRKAATKRQKKSEMYSDKARGNQTFQRKRPFNSKPPARVTDARLLIRSKKNTQITDARQNIKAKPIADAREKIQAKQGQDFEKKTDKNPQVGKIPKVTISNELATNKPYQTSHVFYHITQGSQPRRSPRSPRKFLNPGSTSVNRRLGTGIKIAVKNELAASQSRPRYAPAPTSPPPTEKTFERLKITTLNKDALRRVPVPKSPPPREPSPPPARPIRKRAMQESDDSFDEAPVYGKQWRQQRAEPKEVQEIYRPRQNTKTDNSTLRPMISRKPVRKPVRKPSPVSDEDELPVGLSPIEGTKLQVFNLHPIVSEDDILELFSVLGAVRRARLVKPGEAEVVFIRHENALAAYKKYNNRDLDGQPMEIKIVANDPPKKSILYSWMKEIKSARKKNDPGDVTELHNGVLQQALFKGGSTGTSTRPVVFTVKI